MNTIEKIIAYFEENTDLFDTCIEELDSYNGYLGDDRYFEMYMLDEFYYHSKPTELLNRIFYGYDEDTSNDEHKTEFNPNREFFRYNGYGNLVSADYKDYSDHLDHYAVEAMFENRVYIASIESDETLSGLFDELEKGE